MADYICDRCEGAASDIFPEVPRTVTASILIRQGSKPRNFFEDDLMRRKDPKNSCGACYFLYNWLSIESLSEALQEQLSQNYFRETTPLVAYFSIAQIAGAKFADYIVKSEFGELDKIRGRYIERVTASGLTLIERASVEKVISPFKKIYDEKKKQAEDPDRFRNHMLLR